MRSLLSIAVLMTASVPAFATIVTHDLPEPESMALIAIGAAAMLLARRRKK